ncbi:glycoside hydrolase family 68 protein [Serinibacter salmoneus]|uniref:Beta-fructofuranosidase n=1 Tax=Serinibacter salmoneus TaxID=556530 RepID=A0A2A9CVN7_9MICO|nr:glycoside hydrolase family 68 protein [Serinibacter salmoneus]PFG18478.1 beta-fructofuranosidase [Serinibacter salmoneus]
MSFDLADSWVWDFWFADDGEQHHMFFLYASRALHDPDARHHRASIGHAVSDDLRSWQRVQDALVRSDAPAVDELATWTGSVVRADDGGWHLFYTGARLEPDPAGRLRNVQRVARARSRDLVIWHKDDGALLDAHSPVAQKGGLRYETLTDAAWHDEAFRDPWVMRDPGGDGWHMLITARGVPAGSASTGAAVDARDRGVVGHATSPDLSSWTLRSPLTSIGSGFGQLEVTQVEEIEGRPVLIFSCASPELAGAREGEEGGVWAAPAESALGPFRVAEAYRLTGMEFYSGKLVQQRDGQWCLLAFRHDGSDGTFVGGVSDPMPVAWRDGRLVLT